MSGLYYNRDYNTPKMLIIDKFFKLFSYILQKIIIYSENTYIIEFDKIIYREKLYQLFLIPILFCTSRRFFFFIILLFNF